MRRHRTRGTRRHSSPRVAAAGPTRGLWVSLSILNISLARTRVPCLYNHCRHCLRHRVHLREALFSEKNKYNNDFIYRRAMLLLHQAKQGGLQYF